MGARDRRAVSSGAAARQLAGLGALQLMCGSMPM